MTIVWLATAATARHKKISPPSLLSGNVICISGDSQRRRHDGRPDVFLYEDTDRMVVVEMQTSYRVCLETHNTGERNGFQGGGPRFLFPDVFGSQRRNRDWKDFLSVGKDTETDSIPTQTPRKSLRWNGDCGSGGGIKRCARAGRKRVGRSSLYNSSSSLHPSSSFTIFLLQLLLQAGMALEEGTNQESKPVGGKMCWSAAMDDCMLEIFLSHLAQGRRTPSGWKKGITYTAIREALMLNLNMDVSINNIENRVKTLRGQTLAYKSLNSSCSGFGWNSETMLLTAEEQVWDEALKANPNLKNYKKKLLPRFNEWMDVLGDNTANGNIQRTCSTVDMDAHVTDSVEVSTQHNSDPLLGNFMSFESINLEDDGGTPQSTPIVSAQATNVKKLPCRKRKSLASGLKEEMGNMRATMETFVDVLKEKNRYDDIIWDQISNAIFSIEEMEEDTKVEALEIFSGEHAENLKRCFLRVPEHKRMGWLLKKLANYNQ